MSDGHARTSQLDERTCRHLLGRIERATDAMELFRIAATVQQLYTDSDELRALLSAVGQRQRELKS